MFLTFAVQTKNGLVAHPFKSGQKCSKEGPPGQRDTRAGGPVPSPSPGPSRAGEGSVACAGADASASHSDRRPGRVEARGGQAAPDLPRLEAARLNKAESPHLRIGYLGQIAWHKGVHVLVEAARRIDDPRLSVDIYGDVNHFPDYASRLKRLAEGDARIRLAGTYAGQNEVGKILQELDVIVVPSIWYENCPNVIQEAFAHRIPVIATNLGGMAEMVSHGKSGLLFRVADAADLTAQLRRLLSDPGLLPALRDGVPAVKTFADEVAEIESVYRRVVRAPAALRVKV